MCHVNSDEVLQSDADLASSVRRAMHELERLSYAAFKSVEDTWNLSWPLARLMEYNLVAQLTEEGRLSLEGLVAHVSLLTK